MAPDTLAAREPQDRPLGAGEKAQRALQRPLFFSGQLLSKEDLTLLADWSLSRFQRVQLRSGWGIVRGLAISAVPEAPDSLNIQAGYAIDADGNDIVIPEKQRQPLTEAWEAFAEKGGPWSDGDTLDASFDVLVSYREHRTDFKPVLGKPDCEIEEVCAASRVHESFAIDLAPGHVADAKEDPAAEWLRGYDACLDVIRQFPGDLLNGTESGHPIRAWLNGWIEGVGHDPNHPPHPLTVLPHLKALIAELPEDRPLAVFDLLTLLFFMVQDYRLAYLNETAGPQAHSGAIPLGRIWVGGARKNGKWELSLDSVDRAPPYSRPVREPAFPAPLGMVNVAPILLHRREESAEWLSRHGLRLADLRQLDLESVAAQDAPLDGLLELLGTSPFQSPYDEQSVVFTDFGFDAARIVSSAAVLPAPLEGLDLRAAADRSQAFPGEIVSFRYTARNIGKMPMRINIVDSLIGTVAEDVEIPPRGEFVVSCDYVVPADLEPTEDGTVVLKPDGNLLISDLVFVERPSRDGTAVVLPFEARIEFDVLQAIGLQMTVRRRTGFSLDGREITLVYSVENAGSIFLDVDVTDGKPEPDWRVMAALAPGETASITRQVSCVDTRARYFAAEAVATGTAADTRRVETSASYELKRALPQGVAWLVGFLFVALLVTLGLLLSR